MTKEQEKAIEQLRNWRAESIVAYCIYDTISAKEFNKSKDIVLNLIQTQQEEIEKKDKLYKKAIKGLIKANKIINLMANELIKNNIYKKYCYYVAGSTECNHDCRECIKNLLLGGNKQC